MPLGNELQRLHRGPGNGALAEQRDHMRNDRRTNWITRIEHPPNAVHVVRLQRDDLQDVGVSAAQIRPGGVPGHSITARRSRVAGVSYRA